jgi:transcription-repair coupling factor (superfamily II helicase)
MIPGRVLHTLGLQEGIREILQGAPLRLSGLWGGARALLSAEIARELKRPLLVITATLGEAEGLAADLRFFLDRDRVGLFPEPEVSPFQPVSPPLELRAERIQRLRQLRDRELLTLVVPVQALLRRLLPPEALDAATLHLYPHRIVSPEAVVQCLEAGGYRRVPQVSQAGEYSRRGGILDIALPSVPDPIRIEFFGDEIETIRTFDVTTQRSRSPAHGVEGVTILPLSEVILGSEGRGLARTHHEAKRSPLLQEAVEGGRDVPGLERYLPYFYRETAALWHYLSPGAILVWDDPAQGTARAEAVEVRLREEHERAVAESREERLPPLALTHFRWREVQEALQGWLRVELLPFPSPPSLESSLRFDVQQIPSYHGRFAAFVQDIEAWRREGRRVVLVARSRAQGERLREVLREHDLGADFAEGPVSSEKVQRVQGVQSAAVHILEGELTGGFHFVQLKLCYLTEAEIFGPRKTIPMRRPKIHDVRPLAAFEELKEGDMVVHVDHGIGRFRGLQKLTVGGLEGDYLFLEYAGGDRLYVPVEKVRLVQRYVGAESGSSVGPPLDRLGSPSWAKAKERVKASIKEMARELLKLYAARQVVEGHPYSPDTPWQREFEAAFPYEETTDQLKAIQEVKADMERPRPMDHLVCGDVGYGKTEVAMRAAFKAVMDGKQVAVLVPTTVLALQHLHSFSERFRPFPIQVEMLSRFRSRKEQQQVLRGLRDGTVDIVIGTHRLLQKDVQFRDLGLLVVDEEQRFGVAAKERLKRLRTEVDALTLTATPIPRTLHMAMLGVRDVSTIATPPEDRLSIQTYVTRFDPEVIRQAVEEEIGRGGQVLFVHNRVESIWSMANLLKRLLPHVKMAVAHGQMAEATLERMMCDFYAGKHQLLLSTAIIESGLDIPTANTIIINRADRFGLAQLYQLRGRVGRDRYRAHAYLLIPREEALTEAARKRLQVMAELTELGSGFQIATRDLEIRGAGNLLGTEQHGHINALGFDLYCQLIQEAVQELRGEVKEVEVDPVLRFPLEAYIPEEYVPDASIRLTLYKRLAAAASSEELHALALELRDRFGPLPQPVEHLLAILDLRGEARALGIREVDARGPAVRIAFGPKPPVTPERVVALLEKMGGRLKVLPEETLELQADGGGPMERIGLVKTFLQQVREP